MNKNFDLSNMPDDIYYNGDGGVVGGALGVVTGVVGLVKQKKSNKQSSQERDVNIEKEKLRKEANAAAAQQKAQAQDIISSNKAKEAANSADKILGMKKPVFYGVVGFTLLLLVVGGVVIYKRVNK